MQGATSRTISWELTLRVAERGAREVPVSPFLAVYDRNRLELVHHHGPGSNMRSKIMPIYNKSLRADCTTFTRRIHPLTKSSSSYSGAEILRSMLEIHPTVKASSNGRKVHGLNLLSNHWVVNYPVNYRCFDDESRKIIYRQVNQTLPSTLPSKPHPD